MNSITSIDEEKQLVERVIAGDRLGGKIFLEQYGGLIHAVIRKLDNRSNMMESEDLFMEALSHLFGNNYHVLKSFKWQCKLSTYIYMVTRRCILDILRKEHRIDGIQTSQIAPDSLMAECEEESDENGFSDRQVGAYKEALDQLDPKEALFIRMLVIEKKSTSEVMRFFGWNSENSVYAKKNKVISKLRSLSRKALQRKGVV